MLEIEIDGKKAQVPDGSTVMDAAHQLGVYIPHFCYHKKLSIAANCRMCLVQVEKAPKPLPACATPVTNGMKVFTHSDLAIKAQKGVMEFLLINHPLDCPICDQGGECQLQDMSVGYGPMKSRYTEEKHVVFHKNVGPLISMEEMSRCIHCTRCVRFGQEIAGIMELGMANRNMHSEITTFLGRTVDSELSGNMIDLCPVGALTSKPFRYTARSWELQRRKSISPHDSVGANLVVQVKHDTVMRVLPRENEAVNECWISDKERFSYQALDSDDRLVRPMVKQGGAWREVDWNVALDYVAHGLKDVAREHGGDAVAALAAQSLTLEELHLLAKVMKGLGSGNMDFRPRQIDFGTDGRRAGAPWLGLRLAEIKDLDAALVVGSFLRKDHPLLAQRLRQAAKQGTRVSLIGLAGDDQLIKLHANLAVAPADLAKTLAAVVKAVAEIKGVAIPAGLEGRQACETTRRIAQSLVDGEKRVDFPRQRGNPVRAGDPVACAGGRTGIPDQCPRRFPRRGRQYGRRPCRPGPADRRQCPDDVRAAAQGVCPDGRRAGIRLRQSATGGRCAQAGQPGRLHVGFQARAGARIRRRDAADRSISPRLPAPSSTPRGGRRASPASSRRAAIAVRPGRFCGCSATC